MKKLCKDRANRKVCGVCSGLADYLGVDVNIVRVITLVLCLCWGAGLIVYLACAALLPDKA